MKSFETRKKFEELARLGLKEAPFRISADPRFLYLTSELALHLDRLLDLVVYEEGLGVVQGAVGTGKTTVARRLFELARGEDNDLYPVFIHTASYSTPAVAARDIANHLDLDTHRVYTTQMRIIEEGIFKIRDDGLNPVLIIDDAQHMSAQSLETIQHMINFDVSSKAVQIILFGQDEIHATFNKASTRSVKSRVVTWIVLNPFSFEDTVSMLNWRVQLAGRREPLFSEGALGMIWQTSEGNPRDTIMIANEGLQVLFKQGGQTIDDDIVSQAIDNFTLKS
jgi:type II secretory pathway predicted ATPase ExeA